MNYGDVDAYKYLGVLEGDEIKHTQMKRRIEGEYFRRVRKYLSVNCTERIWSKQSIVGQW